jgi:hypothetical protein
MDDKPKQPVDPTVIRELAAAEYAAMSRAYEKQVAELKNKLVYANSRLRLAEKDLEHAEHRVDFIRALDDPSPVPIVRKDHKPHGTATAILVLSDWHVEEEVDPSTVNGLNEFNLDIASKRIRKTFRHAVRLIEAERQMSNVKDLVVAILGDMISGYIHEELQETNSLSPTEASIFCQDHIVGGIDYLLKESGCKNIIVPTAYGNHARTTAKLRFSTAHKNSYEWLMYKQLERAYRNDPRVTWKVENSYHNWLTVQGKDIRFHHGTAIRYKGGTAGAGVPIRRKIARWNEARPAWRDIFGHLHIFEDGGIYIINPSLIGYGALTEFLGGYWPPMQTLIIVDRNREIPVTVKPIFCE